MRLLLSVLPVVVRCLCLVDVVRCVIAWCLLFVCLVLSFVVCSSLFVVGCLLCVNPCCLLLIAVVSCLFLFVAD